MPRIRTLKPEHRQHRKVGALSHRQYRLWVGMICEADDEGRLVADAAQLRLLIFGFHDDVTPEDVDSDLARVVSCHLVAIYCHGGTRYAYFPDWKQHQRINRPQPSKLPPPKAKRPRKRSVNTHGMNSERAVDIHGGSEGIKDQGSEGIKEGRGVGRETRNGSHEPGSDSDTRGGQPHAIADVISRIAQRHPELQAANPAPPADSAPPETPNW